MADITVTFQQTGEAYVSLVVGDLPEVRDTVALGEHDAADQIPALDGIVLNFDHYGRLVGLRVTDSADSILAPSLIEAATPVSGTGGAGSGRSGGAGATKGTDTP
jgi:hypothetical protein